MGSPPNVGGPAGRPPRPQDYPVEVSSLLGPDTSERPETELRRERTIEGLLPRSTVE